MSNTPKDRFRRRNYSKPEEELKIDVEPIVKEIVEEIKEEEAVKVDKEPLTEEEVEAISEVLEDEAEEEESTKKDD